MLEGLWHVVAKTITEAGRGRFKVYNHAPMGSRLPYVELKVGPVTGDNGLVPPHLQQAIKAQAVFWSTHPEDKELQEMLVQTQRALQKLEIQNPQGYVMTEEVFLKSGGGVKAPTLQSMTLLMTVHLGGA